MMRTETTDPIPARLQRLYLERDGCLVTFKVGCADEYAAIQMYDQAVAAAATGRVIIEVSTKGAVTNG